MRIFLVENEPSVQSYVTAILEKAHHEVVTEANGTKALLGATRRKARSILY